MQKDNFDFFWLLNLLLKNIKLLTIVLFTTLVVSSLVSLFLMEEQFKSSVVIYPTTTNSISKSILIEQYTKDVLEFGEEEEAEQLLQVLNSDEIRDSIINRFDLFTHYEMDRTDAYELHQKYTNSIKIKKTKYNAIKISVFDKSPQLAADMANEYLVLMDFVISRLRQHRAIQALEILEKRKQLLYQERNNTNDSLQVYRSLGMISVEVQAERLTEQYAIALGANNLSGAKRIKQELNKLAEYAGEHDMLLRKIYKIEKELSSIEFESGRVEIDVQYSIDNKFIINRAYPADKKSYPIRWLVVLVSLISVFVFSILYLAISESILSVKE